MKDKIVDIIISAANELNEEEEISISEELSPATRLFGENGVLDSMGLVSLVVAVEQAIDEEFNASVSLADEKALSQKNSPYRTIETLAEYAEKLIQEG